jgi:hypothetical protein
MPVLQSNKHKEYARYAEHCLNMVAATKDQEARALIREMAAEWLKLADMALHPLKRTQRVRPPQYG